MLGSICIVTTKRTKYRALSMTQHAPAAKISFGIHMNTKPPIYNNWIIQTAETRLSLGEHPQYTAYNF